MGKKVQIWQKMVQIWQLFEQHKKGADLTTSLECACSIKPTHLPPILKSTWLRQQLLVKWWLRWPGSQFQWHILCQRRLFRCLLVHSCPSADHTQPFYKEFVTSIFGTFWNRKDDSQPHWELHHFQSWLEAESYFYHREGRIAPDQSKASFLIG